MVDMIVERALQFISDGKGFGYVILAAVLLKVYVINGTINRYFRAKRNDRRVLIRISQQLSKIIKGQLEHNELQAYKNEDRQE